MLWIFCMCVLKRNKCFAGASAEPAWSEQRCIKYSIFPHNGCRKAQATVLLLLTPPTYTVTGIQKYCIWLSWPIAIDRSILHEFDLTFLKTILARASQLVIFSTVVLEVVVLVGPPDSLPPGSETVSAMLQASVGASAHQVEFRHSLFCTLTIYWCLSCCVWPSQSGSYWWWHYH